MAAAAAAAGGGGGTTPPHSSVLFVVPNRAGVGEISTAVEIRTLLERVDARASITILSKERTPAQRAFMQAHLRAGDITWKIEDGDTETQRSILERISALSIKLVIQIPYFDPDMTYWLRKTDPRLPILTLGEYGGLGCSLGFSTPRRLGVLVDHDILARAEDSSLDHEAALTRCLPPDMRERIGPVVKGQFAVAYCARASSLILYLHTLAELAFKLQKKKNVTLVITGPKAEDLTSYVVLSDLEEKHGIKVHLVGDDTVFEETDTPTLRIVPFPLLPQELYGLSLLATTELPALVTGDGSLMKALCAGSLIFYECLDHKKASWFEFMGECIGDIPEIDKFFHQPVDDVTFGEVNYTIFEIAEHYHTLILSRLGVWKAKTRKMLREKDATENLKKVIAPPSEDEARALYKDFNLCRAIDILERESTLPSYDFPGTTAHATMHEKAEDIRRWVLEKAKEENLPFVYKILALADDEELFLALEDKLRSARPSEKLLKEIYTSFFYWLSHMYNVPADWAWSYCLKPEISSRLDWDTKKIIVRNLTKELHRQHLLDLLENPAFFEGKLLEAAQAMIEESYSILRPPADRHRSMHTIFFHKNISEDDRRSLLRILSETLKDNSDFLEDLSRDVYTPYR